MQLQYDISAIGTDQVKRALRSIEREASAANRRMLRDALTFDVAACCELALTNRLRLCLCRLLGAALTLTCDATLGRLSLARPLEI